MKQCNAFIICMYILYYHLYIYIYIYNFFDEKNNFIDSNYQYIDRSI